MKEFIDPLLQNTVKIVRNQKATIGKKVQALYNLIKLSESKNLGEEEELGRINAEFEKYNILLQREKLHNPFGKRKFLQTMKQEGEEEK